MWALGTGGHCLAPVGTGTGNWHWQHQTARTNRHWVLAGTGYWSPQADSGYRWVSVVTGATDMHQLAGSGY